MDRIPNNTSLYKRTIAKCGICSHWTLYSNIQVHNKHFIYRGKVTELYTRVYFPSPVDPDNTYSLPSPCITCILWQHMLQCTFLLPCCCSSGQGSHYGTLGGPTEAFSAANRPREEYKAPGKNFMTSPRKIMRGYGEYTGTAHQYWRDKVFIVK